MERKEGDSMLILEEILENWMIAKPYSISEVDVTKHENRKPNAWIINENYVLKRFTNPDYMKRGIDTTRALAGEGLGVVITKDNIPVSGASSYSRYHDGIEIEIDTKEEFRRKGLAYVCGAKLILECLKRNLYPSWDAHNVWSVALAQKLGYQYDHDYTAYEISGF